MKAEEKEMREQWNNETNKQINKLHQQQQQKKT